MRILLSILIWLSLSLVAFAQNTGGVYPPGFGPDHESIQYRLTVDADNGDWASRLHYQKSISDRLLWRVVGQVRTTANGDPDFDYVQGEIFWDISDQQSQYHSGFRFDARFRDGNRPNQLGFNWMNQWKLDDGWRLRLDGLSTVQYGDNKNDEVILEARSQIAKSLSNGWTIGGELYAPLGDTGDIRFFENTSVSAGPFVAMPIGGGRSVFLQPLFGLTKGARDAELRLWVTQGF